jgi:hypothetical protein
MENPPYNPIHPMYSKPCEESANCQILDHYGATIDMMFDRLHEKPSVICLAESCLFWSAHKCTRKHVEIGLDGSCGWYRISQNKIQKIKNDLQAHTEQHS